MGKRKHVEDLKDQDLPSTSELLVELSTIDEIEAMIPTTGDHLEGTVPQWCELVLVVKRDRDEGVHDINQIMHLRRHDGELICEVLREVLHPHVGQSIIEYLWTEMDKVMDRLMDPGTGGKKVDKGMAMGLAIALAKMTSPYHPDLDNIRAEAVERFDVRVA